MLTAAQEGVVNAREGYHLVIAGAGTGKTTTMVHRMASLAKDRPSDGLLMLTFTRKAAEHMLEKAHALMDAPHGSSSRIQGGTFHGWCVLLLRRFAAQALLDPSFQVADEVDAVDIMQDAMAERGHKCKADGLPRASRIASIYSAARNHQMHIDAWISDRHPDLMPHLGAIAGVVDAYEIIKKRERTLDFDDLLITSRVLLQDRDDVRASIAGSFPWIMVDEFQDVNRIQSDIADMLAEASGNLMVVGDDAQSIYGFRGADVSMMRTFPDRHPNCTIHRIEDNFRSSQNILNAANASLGHMTSAFRKTLRSPRQGDAPAIFIHENPDVMRKRVVDDIKTQRKEGALMGTAVLGRSNRSLIQIEMLLKRERIPYRRFGGLSFDECAHVKDVMSLFKICDNPSDQRSWIRIMQWQEGIGRTTASELGKVLSSGAPLPSKLMKHGSVIAVVKGVMDRMRRGMPSEAFHEAMQYYMPFIPMLYDNERDRSEDLMEMANVVKDFTSLREFLDTFIVDRPDRKTGDPSCTVTLSTIHSAKGLEWDRVHVVDVVTGIFPSSYCATREDYDQERRLFYVAITRPKTHLFIHAFGSQRDASGFMMQTGMSSLCHEIQSVCQVIT